MKNSPENKKGRLVVYTRWLYPFIAQDAGYLSVYISTDEFAGMKLMEHRFYLRCLARAGEENGLYGSVYSLISQLDNNLKQQEARREELERQVQELIPQTSLKNQIRSRLKRLVLRFLPRK